MKRKDQDFIDLTLKEEGVATELDREAQRRAIEVDVKIQAVKSLDNFIRIVSPERMAVLVGHVVALGKDPLGIVRCKNILIQPILVSS